MWTYPTSPFSFAEIGVPHRGAFTLAGILLHSAVGLTLAPFFCHLVSHL